MAPWPGTGPLCPAGPLSALRQVSQKQLQLLKSLLKSLLDTPQHCKQLLRSLILFFPKIPNNYIRVRTKLFSSLHPLPQDSELYRPRSESSKSFTHILWWTGDGRCSFSSVIDLAVGQMHILPSHDNLIVTSRQPPNWISCSTSILPAQTLGQLDDMIYNKHFHAVAVKPNPTGYL